MAQPLLHPRRWLTALEQQTRVARPQTVRWRKVLDKTEARRFCGEGRGFAPESYASVVRNSPKDRAFDRAHLVHPAIRPMTDDRPGTRVPFDEERLQLVREFLQREFRGYQHRDFFAFDRTAQVFVIGSEHGLRRTLVIPKETFEDADFALLFNVQLVTALKLAGGVRITLTPQGARD